MSNIIPPLLSSSPPPIAHLGDDEDDFGEFTTADDLSYCDAAPLPPLFDREAENCKKEKDFQDKRKQDEKPNEETEYNTCKIKSVESSKYSNFQYIPEVPPDIGLDEIDDQLSSFSLCEANIFEDSVCHGEGSDTKAYSKSVHNCEAVDLKNESDGNNKKEKSKMNHVESENFQQSKTVQSNTDAHTCSAVLDNRESKDVINRCENEVAELDHFISYEKQISKISEVRKAVELKNNLTFEGQVSEAVLETNEGNNISNIENFAAQLDEESSFTECEEISNKNEVVLVATNKHDGEITLPEDIISSAKNFSDLNTVTENTCIENIIEKREADALCSDDNLKIVEKNAQFSSDVQEGFGNDDDDFGDFTGPVLQWDVDPFQQTKVISSSDNDFGDFESQVFEATPIPCTRPDDDEFGDFSDYVQTQPFKLDTEAILEKANAVILEMFPVVDTGENKDFVEEDRSDVTFTALQDVTDTIALTYQWSKSIGQSYLLQALNIDTRNILYGPRWNESMPRYAATLGYTPLEPVKSDVAPCSSSEAPSNQTPSADAHEIPSAQFDWVGAGLTNPLEITPKKVIVRAPHRRDPSHNEDFIKAIRDVDAEPADLEAVLRPTKRDGSSVKLSQLEESKETASFPRTEENWLRETHIVGGDSNAEEPGWLKPTIVTPDLPRRNVEQEEEFGDFHSGRCGVEAKSAGSGAVATEQKSANSLPSLKERTASEAVKVSTSQDDDEFTDFQSVAFANEPTQVSILPVQLQAEILRPTAILGPLKPLVQSSTSPATINWPDPGITDDEIHNIELNYKPNTEAVAKADDVEWSDFVSPPQPPPNLVNSVKQPARTSTPELSLSVPHLNQIQPPKRPIPVVTAHGLLQTKTYESLVQPSVQPQQPKPYPQVQQNGIQPSFISSQFAAQLEQGLSFIGKPHDTRNLQNVSGISRKVPVKAEPDSKNDEDDEWTDFVSSRPTQSAGVSVVSNGFHSALLPPSLNGSPSHYPKLNLEWNRPPQTPNWPATAMPNIITNPVSFDSFQSYLPQQQRKAQPKRGLSTMSNVTSVPELEFIGPKSRTWKK